MIYAIGIGSNLDSKHGDQYQTLKKSLELIKSKTIKVLKVSNIYITQPVGMTNVNWFLNAAIVISTPLKPENLLNILKNIEIEMGRDINVPNVSRPCDLDILLVDCDKEYRSISGKYPVIIPHERMHLRMFVLKPLMDVCPNWIHPNLKKTIKNIITELKSTEEITSYDKNL